MDASDEFRSHLTYLSEMSIAFSFRATPTLVALLKVLSLSYPGVNDNNECVIDGAQHEAT
jgi:hypothetical protein